MVKKKMKSYPQLKFEKKAGINPNILICINCGSDKTYKLESDLWCKSCGLSELVRRSDLIPDVIPKERKPSGPMDEPDVEFDEENVK